MCDVCLCLPSYVCMTNKHVCRCESVCVCVCVYIYVCVCVCFYADACVCPQDIYTHMGLCIHTHIHTHTYTHKTLEDFLAQQETRATRIAKSHLFECFHAVVGRRLDRTGVKLLKQVVDGGSVRGQEVILSNVQVNMCVCVYIYIYIYIYICVCVCVCLCGQEMIM